MASLLRCAGQDDCGLWLAMFSSDDDLKADRYWMSGCRDVGEILPATYVPGMFFAVVFARCAFSSLSPLPNGPRLGASVEAKDKHVPN